MFEKTIVSLSKYIKLSKQAIHNMKRDRPKQFELLWAGWLITCDNNKGEL